MPRETSLPKCASHASHRKVSEELSAEHPVCLPGHRNCCCPRNLVHPKTRTPHLVTSLSVREPACISNSKHLHPKATQGSMKSQTSPGTHEDAAYDDFTHWDSRSISSTCINVERENRQFQRKCPLKFKFWGIAKCLYSAISEMLYSDWWLTDAYLAIGTATLRLVALYEINYWLIVTVFVKQMTL